MTKETVYVTRVISNRTTYHTRECASYPNNPQEWDRETAEAWGLEECMECAGSNYRQEWGRSAPSIEEDGMVWVATSSHKHPEAYHTRDCNQVPGEDGRRLQSREIAESRGLEECEHCRGEAISEGEHGPQLAAKLKRIGEAQDD